MTGIRKYIWLTAFVLSAVSTDGMAQANSLPASRLDSSMQASARPVLMLLSTDWCRYCRMQKYQLLRNKNFSEQENLFYYVEFNAESKEEVIFQGRRYGYKATGISTGIHELAMAVNGSETISFPTWILLDKNSRVIFRYNGVLEPGQMKSLLTVIEEM